MAEFSDASMTRRAERAVAGVILCGGAGSRLGGEKALVAFGQGRLLDAVRARATPQVFQLALNVSRGNAETYRSQFPEYPLLFDPFPQRVGPLAGVIAGLEWARALGDAEWLATFPCDTPFLPRDLVAQLMASASDAPVFAHDGERLHCVFAVWPLHCLDRVRSGVEGGELRSLQSAVNALRGMTCRIEAGEHAFFNINTREDLSRAEELAREI
jgi:molybdopterin-guanine dinucleotide biosynthesis protein A